MRLENKCPFVLRSREWDLWVASGPRRRRRPPHVWRGARPRPGRGPKRARHHWQSVPSRYIGPKAAAAPRSRALPLGLDKPYRTEYRRATADLALDVNDARESSMAAAVKAFSRIFFSSAMKPVRRERAHSALSTLGKPSSAIMPRSVVPRRCARAIRASARLTLRASNCWSNH
jgi:hypothetical protein